ncbi:GNAT family N-acetyltransferase [Alkalibacterium iburiense]
MKEDTTEFKIVIGESKLWGKGLGSKAAELMIAYGTKELRIKTILAETH